VTNPTTKSELRTPNPELSLLTPRRFALVLAVLLAVTFWRVLFGGEAFFYRDYGFLGYPFAHFHRECFWSGDFFPLWNPYVNCGAPYLAQWNTLCLYPGSLLYLLLPLPWSLGLFCVAHLFLGGMGMRALAERWTGSSFSAAVAGVAFIFSGLVLGCTIYPNYLVALGWMPWVVLATRRAWQEGGRSLVLAALTGAMQMLTGAPEIILLTWGFLAALVVVDWVQSPKSKVQSWSAQGCDGEQGDSSLTPALSRWEREGASATAETSHAPLAKPAPVHSAPQSAVPESTATQPTSPPLLAGEGRGEGERAPIETTVPPSVRRATNHYSLITRFFAVIALITGLCAAQLLPFLQLLSLSQRSGDAVNSFWSLPGWGWVNLFFPLFMNFQTEQGVFVMIGQAFFPSVYLGIVPLTLALLAVWRVRTPEVKLLGTATLLAVLLAMGDNFVLWRALREVLPLGIMRFPIKALLLAAFTVPLLAAWGMKWLEDVAVELPKDLRQSHDFSPEFWRRLRAHEGWREVCQLLPVLLSSALAVALLATLYQIGEQPVREIRLRTLLVALQELVPGMFIIACVVFTLGWRYRNRFVLFPLVLLPICTVFTHHPILNPTIPASAFEPGLAAAYHASKDALTPAPKLGESRIMLSPLAERALHTRMVPKFYDDFIGQRLAFWGNLNLLDGLPKVNGASTLVTREWNDVEYFLYGTTNPAPANLMDFLGVTHTTKPGELMQWERRTNALPLVSLPQQVIELGREFDPLPEWMQKADWDPRSLAFLTKPKSGESSAEFLTIVCYTQGQKPPTPLGAVRVSRFATSQVELEVEANMPRWVVLAQNHYPSWQATVNGEKTVIRKANHAFQAIPVPAGQSTVHLTYVDWHFRIGGGISLAGLAVCGLLWWRAGCGPTTVTEVGGTGE
jgi:hypothetical protein